MRRMRRQAAAATSLEPARSIHSHGQKHHTDSNPHLASYCVPLPLVTSACCHGAHARAGRWVWRGVYIGCTLYSIDQTVLLAVASWHHCHALGMLTRLCASPHACMVCCCCGCCCLMVMTTMRQTTPFVMAILLPLLVPHLQVIIVYHFTLIT
jgi:hypothetical protein